MWKSAMKQMFGYTTVLASVIGGILLGMSIVSAYSADHANQPVPQEAKALVPESSALVRAWDKLSPSVDQITSITYRGRVRSVCTTWKVAPHIWVTAKHCSNGSDYKIRGEQPDFIFQSPNKGEDWAVFYFEKGWPEVPSLGVNCSWQPTIGDDVAWVGFPAGVGKVISDGYISGDVGSTRDERYDYLDADFFVTGNSVGGFSGSPVLDLKTDTVVGVLVEGIDGVLIGVDLLTGSGFCNGKMYQAMEASQEGA